MKKIIESVILGMIALIVLIQLVPYGRDHTNPPVVQEPQWTSEQARQVAQRACYDCHSNETEWPWYSNIAPLSWLVQQDVEEGRNTLNFSTWGQGEQELEEAGEVIAEGEMPPGTYLVLHPSARLSEAEKSLLVSALSAMGSGEGGEEREEIGDHD